MSRLPITESDLHAYADDLLSASRRQEVDGYLASRPEEMERIQAWRDQNDALRELFDPVLDEPVPPRLHMNIDASVEAGVHRHFGPAFLGRYAAALLIALAGGVGGWMLHGASQPSATLTAHLGTEASLQVAALAHQAAVAHAVYSPDVRRPVEVTSDDEDALVKWLSKRIGTPLHPPKLGKLGYELMGGRLLPGQTGPVAQFMYQDAGGQRLTLYVSTDQAQNTDTGFRFAKEGQINVFYWIDGKFGYALSGGIDKSALSKIANAVYEQLDVPR
ncbi:anti-sigma factor family protein [Oxalicibacterium solurbis]|uniref:Membrane protein n=1 Tax=Oxalicibacterium solurbis TaxID=69280 RepID=A0A8J3F6V2_9BURK|nr:anti-sigma factor [Oxalicibacterium solurbis]GGI54931.1 membrane protein [Oxalicibacterium solurbis]